jgi:hypothetical protein
LASRPRRAKQENANVNAVRDDDEISISIRQALDEQTDLVFALSERVAYLTEVEEELRSLLREAHQLLLARDEEVAHLLQLVQQQQEQVDALTRERNELLRSVKSARKILRDVQGSRAYRTLRQLGRWDSVDRDMRRYLGK